MREKIQLAQEILISPWYKEEAQASGKNMAQQSVP
jgi:hypothetical protein